MGLAAAPILACTCQTIGAPAGVRLCEEHHRYWNADKQLQSVTRIIRETWPLKKEFEKADPEVLEHARERGIRVDKYVSAFVTGGGVRIPAGEWQEVVELVQKFVPWWLETAIPPGKGKAKAQVLLHDDEIAGTCDIVQEHFILDLKTVYNLDPTYALQLGAYAELYEKTFGVEPAGVGLIHLTKRHAKPQWVPMDLAECRRDWLTLRSTWAMVQRRTNP